MANFPPPARLLLLLLLVGGGGEKGGRCGCGGRKGSRCLPFLIAAADRPRWPWIPPPPRPSEKGGSGIKFVLLTSSLPLFPLPRSIREFPSAAEASAPHRPADREGDRAPPPLGGIGIGWRCWLLDMGANKEVSLFVWEGESNTKVSGGVSNKGGGGEVAGGGRGKLFAWGLRLG